MLSEHEQELVQAAVDGELDAAGRHDFEQLLEHNEHARELHAELIRFTAIVAAVPGLEPPAGLVNELSSRLRLQGRRQNRESLMAAFASGWRFALAGLAALAVFLLVYQARPDLEAPVSHRSLVATIAPASGRSSLRSLERRQYRDPVTDLELRMGSENERLLLEISIHSSEQLEFELDSSGTGLSVQALAQQAGKLGQLSSSHGLIQGMGQGDHQLLVVLTPASPQAAAGPARDAITYRITRAGELLDSGSMRLP